MSPIELPWSARPRVSLIVVSTGSGARVEGCIGAIAAAASSVAFETFVMLDGASNAQAADLARTLDGVQVEASAVTLGLAGALNHAREFARGEFLVFVHDDTVVRVGWLEALVAAADRDGGAGAVGSVAIGTNGRPRPAGWVLDRDCRIRRPRRGEPPALGERDSLRAVDYCGSSSLLVRTSSWDLVHGADERLFPLYYVDVDLCLALRARGQRVICEPLSVVVHDGGASTTHDYARFVAERNREVMIEKWGNLIRTHVPGSGATHAFGPDELPRQERATDPTIRERAQLERTLATANAYIDHIEAGGWWRVRGGLVRILRTAAPLRRRLVALHRGRAVSASADRPVELDR